MIGALDQVALDACTLNNALNVAQLIALVVVIRWLRTGTAAVLPTSARADRPDNDAPRR